MRILFTILLALSLSTMAFASGKISIQGNYFGTESKDIKPMAGFGVYEKVARNLYVNSWLGYGAQPLEHRASDLDWFVAKAQLDLRMNRLTVSPGVQYKYVKDANVNIQDTIPFVKLDYQLW